MKYNSDIITKSIYIHWPFCAYKCDYCSFVSFAGKQDFMSRYSDVLLQEMSVFFSDYRHKNIDLETIFIGGGTPSTWPDDKLLDTFAKLNSDTSPFKSGLYKNIDDKNGQAKNCEFTIEVNPATVREEQFEIFKSIGVNRFSIGVQSLDDDILISLNRRHSADDVRKLISKASSYFENISIDLILGLPGVSFDAWRGYLEEIVCWPIKHVSVYFLTIYENTVLYKKIEAGLVKLLDDDQLVSQYEWTVEFLEKHGFFRYEISNFAKKGYESKHNKVYWERKPYKGFGLSACSFDGTCRYQNKKDLLEYIESAKNLKKDFDKIDFFEKEKTHLEGKFEENLEDVFVDFYEKLDEKQIRLEKIMLGLRTDNGISKAELFQGLDLCEINNVQNRLDELIQKKCINERNGRFLISPSFLTMENEIVVELL